MAKVKTEKRGSVLWSGQRTIQYHCDSEGVFSVHPEPEMVATGVETTLKAKSLAEVMRKWSEAHQSAAEAQRSVERFILVYRDDDRGHADGYTFNIVADVFDMITTNRPGGKPHIRFDEVPRDEKGDHWHEFGERSISCWWRERAQRLPFTPELNESFRRLFSALLTLRTNLDTMTRDPQAMLTWAAGPLASLQSAPNLLTHTSDETDPV